MRAATLDRTFEAEARLAARLLFGMTNSSPWCWRTARRTTQTPRRPNGSGGARGANRSGSASVTSIHAPFTTEVECKMASFTHVRISGFMPLA